MTCKANELDKIRDQAREVLDQLREETLAQRSEQSHWTGELSASALSTATAVSAIAAVLRQKVSNNDRPADGPPADNPTDSDSAWMTELVHRGMQYLRGEQNPDGGFGDTDRSHSNVATSYLVLAADALAREVRGEDAGLDFEQREELKRYLRDSGEIEGLKARYGTDKTFVVPILSNMAIAGLVDWKLVSPLPFEAAVFPQSWYRFLRMPVVSYAIPALVAIGQARHFLGPRSWFAVRAVRAASVNRTMAVLQRMQPDSGGYLEATPLTAFVLMSLAATGRQNHPVALQALRFLRESVSSQGSWPIDTNLATWVTSLSIHALACDPEDDGSWYDESLLRWHLGCQHRVRHPFTGARPGGWGWTDLSGAVPDGDDTPGAILALEVMRRYSDPSRHRQLDEAIADGRRWLRHLQNRDGGWPTFCRGWGKLPFDRSSTDLTAHAIRALPIQEDAFDGLIKKGRRYLQRKQRSDGSWLPLWFGNQDLPNEINPVYGTAKVLTAGIVDQASTQRGIDFLVKNQNPDGGWGGGPSVRVQLLRMKQENAEHAEIDVPGNLHSSMEETALAIEALSTILLRRHDAASGTDNEDSAPLASQNERKQPVASIPSRAAGVSSLGPPSPRELRQPRQLRRSDETESLSAAIISGVEFLIQGVRAGRHRVAWPIGFYFAKLWYHEHAYPLIFTVAALGKFLRATADEHDPNWPR